MCSPMMLQIITTGRRLGSNLGSLHTTRGPDDMGWSSTVSLGELLCQSVISLSIKFELVRLEEMNANDARIKEGPRNGRSDFCSCVVNRDGQTGNGWHGKRQEARGKVGAGWYSQYWCLKPDRE